MCVDIKMTTKASCSEEGPSLCLKYSFESSDGRLIHLTFDPELCSGWDNMNKDEKIAKVWDEFGRAEHDIEMGADYLVFGIVKMKEELLPPYDDDDEYYEEEEEIPALEE